MPPLAAWEALAFNFTRALGVLAGARFSHATTATIRTRIVNVPPAGGASSARRLRLRVPRD